MAIHQSALEPDSAPERIRKAAIALFRERGYHGTPVRVLARAVRMEAGSFYYHFPSKQEILFGILDHTMDELLDGLRRATEGGSGPAERLKAAVRFHVLFHARHRDEAFVSRSELRALTAANLRRSIAKRDRYQLMFRMLLMTGIKAGVFEVPDVRLTAMGILAMCSGVAEWFSEGGRLSPEAVADYYAEIVLRTVSRPSGAGPTRLRRPPLRTGAAHRRN